MKTSWFLSNLSLRSYYRNSLERTLVRKTRELSLKELAGSCIVFSPHFDDETLGCGGVIAKKILNGSDITVVFLSDGSRSHHQWMEVEKLVALRHAEAIDAVTTLGVSRENIVTLGFPETQLPDHAEQILDSVEDLLDTIKPDQVFMPYSREPLMWSDDHITTTQIVANAILSHPGPIQVFEYPIWAWFHFPWIGIGRRHLRYNLFNCINFRLGIRLVRELNSKVSIECVLDQKRAALSKHRSQMMELIPDVGWPTLHDVAGGEFLNLFFGKYEYFRISQPSNWSFL